MNKIEKIKKPKRQNKYLAALKQIELQNGGLVTPKMVVDSARNEISPLHNYFTWDDKKAGEAYRIYQARILMTTVKIEVQGSEKQDAYFNAKIMIEEVPVRGYVPMQTALNDELIYKQVLSNATRELKYWTNKYNSIKELKELVNEEKIKKMDEKIKE